MRAAASAPSPLLLPLKLLPGWKALPRPWTPAPGLWRGGVGDSSPRPPPLLLPPLLLKGDRRVPLTPLGSGRSRSTWLPVSVLLTG